VWDLLWQCLIFLAAWIWTNLFCWWWLVLPNDMRSSFERVFEGLGDALGQFLGGLLLAALALGGAVVLGLVLIVRALRRPAAGTAVVAAAPGSCSPIERAAPPAG